MSSDDPLRFIAESLQKHNEYRSIHGVAPLVHNSELSRIAQSWADRVASSLQFQHSKNKYKNEALGENLAMWGSSGATRYDGAKATTQWYNEIKLYDFSNAGFKSGTGHFTQVVWKDTREVGFGVARGRDGNFYAVANYYPAGNFQGRFKENVLPPRPLGEVAREASERMLPSRVDSKPAHFQMQQKFIEQALKAHNSLRAQHNASPLKLNDQLSRMAYKWAEHLATRDCLDRSNTKLNDEPLGENISMWSNTSADDEYDGQYATQQWYRTKKFYDFDRKEFNQDSSCFTQLIWKSTKEVGFGVARASSGHFYAVANYFPAGNFPGEFRENISK